MSKAERQETAVIGGGCFWCIEAQYQRFKGVEKVESGYAGGKAAAPSYEHVSSGGTGHAEVVKITFNPDVLSYHDLLEIFFHVHDPTTLNRQGADAGTQYRSIILYNSDEQKRMAESVKAEVQQSGLWSKRIVTQIAPLDNFYRAEDYHQNYYNQNANKPYCQLVIGPKLQKLYSEYRDKLKPEYATSH